MAESVGAISVGEVYVDVLPSTRGFSDELKAKLRNVGAVQVPVDADTRKAETSLHELIREVGRDMTQSLSDAVRDGLGKAPAKAPGKEKGEEFGGAFGDSARRRIEAALKALPKVEINADSSDADIKIQTLRSSLETLSGKRIGVDIDAQTALGELAAIRQELEAVDGSYPVDVQVNAARAREELAALQAEVDKVAAERPTVTVDADTARARAELATVGDSASGSIGGVSSLTSAILAIGPAAIPVAASAAAALAAIGAAAGAGVAGIGVLALGFSGISDAVKALGSAQSEAGKSAASYAASQQSAAFAIANAQSSLQAAEASLANARASAASAAVTAAERVKNAQLGVADATRQAAAGVTSALQQEENAERDLASAQQAALGAQRALNDARAAAKQNLEDLAQAVADGALQQRAAVLGITQAKLELDKTLADPKASELQRQQAQLNYDQAVQQLSDVQLRNQRLAEQKAAADKAGIDGSKQVLAAQQNIAAANQRVADAQDAVGRAAAAVSEAQRKGAEQVAKAQQALADAVRAQADQQRQSAASVASAVRGVENAQRSLAQAHASAAAGAATASAATSKLAQEMGKLSPAGQEFARFIFGLRPELDKLKAAAQTGLLPGVQAGIEALLPLMPSITTFVGDLASAMGDLFREAGQALTSPFWQQALATFEGFATPAVSSIGHILGDIATGFAGLFTALSPLSGDILGGIENLARSFADFGKDAAGGGLQGFIDYVTQTGPTVVSVISNLADIAGTLIQALAPLGGVVLGIVDAVTGLLAGMGPDGLLLTLGLLAGAVGVATGGFGAILGAVVLFGAELVRLYQHSEPVRRILNSIGDYVTGTLVPILQGIGTQALAGLRAGFDDVKDAVGRNKDQLKQLLDVAGAFADFVVTKLLPIMGTQLNVEFQALGLLIGGVIDTIGLTVRAFEGLTTGALSSLGFILDGADRAFGWLPKLGPKLDTAVKEFDKFRDGVNASFDGLTKSKTISVQVNAFATVGGSGPYANKRIPLAAGGAVSGPGTGTSDSIPAMLSNGEHVWTASEVQAAGGHGAVMQMRKAVRGYAKGGPVTLGVDTSFPSITSFSSGVTSAITQAVQSSLGQALGSAISSTASSSGGIGGGVTRWATVALAALAELRQPASLLGAVLRRIQFESGGNPNAINLYDSNAQAGHPSQGLMQTIPSTFAAYAGPYRSRGITDPLANIYAGLNYALDRYGSIAAIDPNVRPYGYDSGGMLEPGMQLVYNGTGQPERILDAHQTQVFEQAMARTGSSGSSAAVFNLYDVDGMLIGTMRGEAAREIDRTFSGVEQAAMALVGG